MVDPELLQKDILTKIKTFQIYVTGITLHFAESQVQDDDFNYPAIRVMIISQIPIGNGTDRLKLSNVNFVVRVYSEKRSGYETSEVLGIINNKLFNRQIDGKTLDGIATYRLNRIDLLETKNPIRLAERLWMAETFFRSEATSYETIGST